MRKRYRKCVPPDLPFVKGDLGPVLKKPDQQAAVRAALAFRVVPLYFFPPYLKAAVGNPLIPVPALAVQEMLVWGNIISSFPEYCSPNTSLITGMISGVQSFSSVRNTSS